MRASRLTAKALECGLLSLGIWAWIALDTAAGEKTKRKTANPLPDQATLGQRIFLHQWVPADRNSHGGDGLGPVFNDRSCVNCHSQGGIGGSGPAEKNVDVVTAFGPGLGARPASISPGASTRLGASARGPATTTASNGRRELAALHPGFEVANSVVLHRFGTSPDYAAWRRRLMSTDRAQQTRRPRPSARQVPTVVDPTSLPASAEHGRVTLFRTERNATALFGAGLIEDIPDGAIEAAARIEYPDFPKVKGRVSRTNDGRVGRFGWKGQIAGLSDFIQTACAVEIGLEVPGHHQSADPATRGQPAPGLDLSQRECDALFEYVRSLPAPMVDLVPSRGGEQIFEGIGCAACHRRMLGGIDGIYSDLLLHDMGRSLADAGSYYNVFTPRSPGEEVSSAGEPGNAGKAPTAGSVPPEPKPQTVAGATGLEWRTPPLWGLADSAPYLHDGRALTIDAAIRAHGGEARDSMFSYLKLAPVQQKILLDSLGTLRAPG